MKNAIILLALSVVAFSACKKKHPLDPYYPNDGGDLQYTIEGVKDMTLEQTGMAKMTVFFKKVSGASEDLSLSMEDLPKGASFTYSPIVGSVSFNSVLTINTTRVAAGNYTVKVKASGAKSGIKTASFVLKVTPYTNGAIAILGHFNETGNCSQSNGVNNIVNIDTVSTINKVVIKGLYAGGTLYTLNATLDPSNSTITVPFQTNSQADFQGSGTYNDSTITIHYTVNNTLVHDTCSTVLKRE